MVGKKNAAGAQNVTPQRLGPSSLFALRYSLVKAPPSSHSSHPPRGPSDT